MLNRNGTPCTCTIMSVFQLLTEWTANAWTWLSGAHSGRSRFAVFSPFSQHDESPVIFPIKICVLALHSPWNSQGPSRIGSVSFEANSPENIESDISIGPSICKAKVSLLCRHFSIVRRLPAFSENRLFCLFILPRRPFSLLHQSPFPGVALSPFPEARTSLISFREWPAHPTAGDLSKLACPAGWAPNEKARQCEADAA
jgi:hypothetical protein